MSFYGQRELLLDIQRTGEYLGKTAYAFNLMGRRDSFTSSTLFNDVGMGIGVAGVADFPIMVGTETVQVLSDNANDASAGTGARQIKLTYIDVNYALVQTAAINLNGVNPATVCTDCRQALWFDVVALGSNGASVGNLTLRYVSPTTVISYIPAGSNKSLDAIFMVPDGFTAYCSGWSQRGIKNQQDFRLRATTDSLTRDTGTVYHFQDRSYLPADDHNGHELPYLKYKARARIKISDLVSSIAAGTRADCDFVIYLIQD